MAEYQFITRWRIATPIETAWEAIFHAEQWPLWWDAVEAVEELSPGEANGLGRIGRFVWKTPLSYTLTFETRVVTVQAPELLEAIAIGDVEGKGLWRLSSTDCGTEIVYTWKVRTTKRWMNYLAGMARPLLQWNHNTIMNHGGLGLATFLEAELISMDSFDQSTDMKFFP